MSEIQWVDSYRKGDDYSQDLGGVSWAEARKPPFWHRCKPQSRARFDGEFVERCACGGIRFDGAGPWVRRRPWVRRHR